MATIQTINTGTADNAHDGEGLRSAMQKVNQNFANLNADYYPKAEIDSAFSGEPSFQRYLHKKRVTADAGTVRDETLLRKFYKLLDDNNIPQPVVCLMGEAGLKQRTSGVNVYAEKAYSLFTPSEKLGPELIINRGFDADTDWSKNPTWSISNGTGVATLSGVNDAIYQTNGVIGRKYLITFEIKTIASGGFKVKAGTNYGTSKTIVGVHSEIIDCAGSTSIGIASAVLNTSGTIDNVSVKEVLIQAGVTDATQTTANLQPAIGGNVAPNEKYCLKNVNGDSRYLAHPTISFGASDKWTVQIVLNWNGSNSQYTSLFGHSTLSYFSLKETNNVFYFQNNAAQSTIGGGTSKLIGKNSILTIVAEGNGTLKIYSDSVLLSTLNTLGTNFSMSKVIEGYMGRFHNGIVYYHTIFNSALTSDQITATSTWLRSQFPEITSVTIGTQVWATSNYEAVCTPQGNLIQEMQSAANTEKITNAADRDFSADTGNWTKLAGVTIAGGVATIITDDPAPCLTHNQNLVIGKWYKLTYEIKRNSLGGLIYYGFGATYNIPSAVGIYTIYGLAASTVNGFKRQSSCNIDIDNISVQEVGWADSQNLYDYIYAQTAGTAEQKTYAAVKAAAMWSHYNNDLALGAIYGKLYNWFAVKLLQMDIDYWNTANPASKFGYHVPSQAEFTTLLTTLGGDTLAGGKMKLSGTNYWSAPNTSADNTSGFSGLPAGRRSEDGSFGSINSFAGLQIITEETATQIRNFELTSGSASLSRGTYLKTRGFSLRLLKD